jgi:mannose-1-phosphate guanylyltransferase
MKIDYCLILAAGFGTRMGDIGQKLPKVLWPIFEKNLLHLQILYAKKLGIKKIFINLHHQRDLIKSFIESLNDETIIVLEEDPEILDIGGGIHNLAHHSSVNYQGKVLILNSDQFLLFSQEQFEVGFNLASVYGACLFAINVSKSGKYNQTVLDNNDFLQKIIPEKLVVDENFWTYSGISIIDLSFLERSTGPSKFFESVAPYQKKKIPNVKLTEISYWDFGTLPRYYSSMFKIISKTHKNELDSFINFLIETKAMNPSKIGPDSYFSKIKGVINLSSHEINAAKGSIILATNKTELSSNQRLVVYNEIIVDMDAK